MRPSTLAASVIASLALAALLTLADAARLGAARSGSVDTRSQLAERLGLTDLALFTEARYTRHRAVADQHSAFQDHPHGLEHFPSGSLLPPPAHLTRSPHEAVDRETALPR